MGTKQDIHPEITENIIGAAIEVHRHLGPGLLESIYEECLVYELNRLGMRVDRQVSIPIRYKDMTFEKEYRLDLLVDNLVIVEIKAVEKVTSVHAAQILTYMKITNKPVGLILNFNEAVMKDGIRRYVL